MAKRCFSIGSVKRAFYVCSAVFWVLGLGCLLTGLWAYIAKRAYVDLIPSSYDTLSAVGLCVAAGLTVIIITSVGGLGVWTESYLLLLTYIFFIFLLLMLQFVISAIALNYQSDVYRRVHNDMERSLKYYKEVFSSSRLTWDELQTVFGCCGVNGPADWFGNQKWPNSSYVPDSCCDKIHFNPNTSMENCGKGQENWERWHHRGCSEVYSDWLFEEIKVAAYISMAFICVEVLLLGPTIVLFRSLQKDHMSYNCSHLSCRYRKGINADIRQEKLRDANSLN